MTTFKEPGHVTNQNFRIIFVSLRSRHVPLFVLLPPAQQVFVVVDAPGLRYLFLPYLRLRERHQQRQHKRTLGVTEGNPKSWGKYNQITFHHILVFSQSNEDETEDLSYNENNNQERGNSGIDDAAEQPHHHHELIESETQQQQHSGQQPQHTGPQQQPPPPPPYHPVQMQKRRKKRRKSILKLDDVENGERDRGIRRPSKSNVSFNDAVAVKYHHRNSSVLSTSLSSSSLSSRDDDDDRENIVSQR